MKKEYISEEGYKELLAELNELRTQGRAEIARAISEAREKGDLSENAEYHAAKEAQEHLEIRISRLEESLSRLRVMDQAKVDTSKVQAMTVVEVKNLKTGKILKYRLVSEQESDVKSGKISVNSPIGMGLLGKKVGEKATISIPSGVIELEIRNISTN